MSGFDNFDFGKLAKGAGTAVKGIVKAARPEAGPGMDEAGTGLSDILKAAGLDLAGDEEPTQPAERAPVVQRTDAATVRAFDRFDFAPKAQPPSRPPPPALPPQEPERRETERDRAIEALVALGYSGPEIEAILAGPPSDEPARREPEAEARTAAATAITAAQPARRIKGAPARRVPTTK